MLSKTAICRKFFPLQTANVACFQRKIQLFVFSAYPDVPPSRLIHVRVVLLYVWPLCSSTERVTSVQFYRTCDLCTVLLNVWPLYSSTERVISVQFYWTCDLCTVPLNMWPLYSSAERDLCTDASAGPPAITDHPQRSVQYSSWLATHSRHKTH